MQRCMESLSQTELDAFWRDGFLVLRGRFGEEELVGLRDACEGPGLRPERLRRGGEAKLLHLLEACARHPRFLALARDSRLTGPIGQILGPESPHLALLADLVPGVVMVRAGMMDEQIDPDGLAADVLALVDQLAAAG